MIATISNAIGTALMILGYAFLLMLLATGVAALIDKVYKIDE